MERPTNINLPFFAYGVFRRGQLACFQLRRERSASSVFIRLATAQRIARAQRGFERVENSVTALISTVAMHIAG
jgi:hypothetical protein